VKPVKPPAVVRPLGVLPPEMMARPTHKAPAHVTAPERPAPRVSPRRPRRRPAATRTMRVRGTSPG
jgi:hypothetical protein